MKLTILVDGDLIAVTIASAMERDIDWGEGLHTLHADVDEAKHRIDEAIASYKKTTDADEVVVCLSDPARRYVRHDICPNYKSGRSGRAPLCLPQLKDHMAAKYRSFIRPGLEADDVLGILQTSKSIIKGRTMIVSNDKDMKTIPGELYNPGKNERCVVSLEEADRFHLYQTLVGDSVDGYPGCPGVGPVKAEKLLEKEPTWAAVLKAFTKAGVPEDGALVQARLARILRNTDYDFKRKEPILWSPAPTSDTTTASS
jgi:DNA polymerase-1